MAATSPVAKLLQRKLYTFVSSKWGLPVCVLGVLLLLISIFQFGEVRRLHFIVIEQDHSSFVCKHDCNDASIGFRCSWNGVKKDTQLSSVYIMTILQENRLKDSKSLHEHNYIQNIKPHPLTTPT